MRFRITGLAADAIDPGVCKGGEWCVHREGSVIFKGQHRTLHAVSCFQVSRTPGGSPLNDRQTIKRPQCTMHKGVVCRLAGDEFSTAK
jgi:hypothetical protein